MKLFSKVFSSKDENTALGIDIGSSAIKIVELERKGGQAVLKTYGELALGPYADFSVGQAVVLPTEKIAEALTNLMQEKEVNITSKKAGLAIPFSLSLMTVVEIPEVSAKELASMVPIEARKHVPVPISEVMLDWSIVPKTNADSPELIEENEGESPSGGANSSRQLSLKKMDVLIVAIHNETIAKYQDIMSKAGVEPSFFEIEIYSTARSVLDDTVQPVLIMDMGAASTKVYILERGIVRTSHTINRGSQDITSAIAKAMSISFNDAEVLKRQVGATGENKNVGDVITLVLNHIFAEANNTLLSFEKKYNKAVVKSILVGGGSTLKGLSELAQNSFKTEVFLADPFSKVSTPAFLENILKQTGPEFAVAIGLALRQLGGDEK